MYMYMYIVCGDIIKLIVILYYDYRGRHLFTMSSLPSDFEPHHYFKRLYPCIVKDIKVCPQ